MSYNDERRYGAPALTPSRHSMLNGSKKRHLTEAVGKKVYGSLMLEAWRERGNKVKQLTEEADQLKQTYTDGKNQLHHYKDHLRIEKQHNNELESKIKRAKEELGDLKCRSERLCSSLLNIKADKDVLEQKLQVTCQNFGVFNTVLTRSKSELFKAMGMLRNLQRNLTNKQRKAQFLENEKTDLIDKICDINSDSIKKRQQFHVELKLRDSEIQKIKAAIKSINDLHTDIVGEIRIRKYVSVELELICEIKILQAELRKQQQHLDATIDKRLMRYWNNALDYQQGIVRVLHWFAYYLMPAYPRPKTNFSLSFVKTAG